MQLAFASCIVTFMKKTHMNETKALLIVLWAVLIDDALHLSRGLGRVIVGYADDISAASASVDPVVATSDLELLCVLLVDWFEARKLEFCPTKSTVFSREGLRSWRVARIFACPSVGLMFFTLPLQNSWASLWIRN